MSGNHINCDRRLYLVKTDVEKSKCIVIGLAKLVFCTARNAWIQPGGIAIRDKDSAEKYAIKMNAYLMSISA